MTYYTKEELKSMVSNAKKSTLMRKKLQNNTFFKKNNSYYIKDMFDDSKIILEKCPKTKIRIGKKYQATIPDNS